MNQNPIWLPPLVLFATYDGNWNDYIEIVYKHFKKDFIDNKPKFNLLPVEITYHPLYQGKEHSFWHLTSEGKIEDERTPDFRRCERICWIRAVIENVGLPAIKTWDYQEAKCIRTYIWLKDWDYVVVLQKRNLKRKEVYLLITAFCVSGNSTRKKLQRKYDQRIL